MDGFVDKSMKKTIIPVSRNDPVALVVGAAGFLGSFLSERLIKKGIQVIGVDNFKKGKRINLDEVSRDKKFHLVEEDIGNFLLETDRLDYIFITVSGKFNLRPLLALFKEKAPRLLFVSSIQLYSKELEEEKLQWLKKAEGEIASFAGEHKLNARILRLSTIYGPRMSFKSKDPIVKLIKKALTNGVSDATSDFSTRALYVDDAVELMVKCILAGSTALKIFDGSLIQPIKIDDVRQILLDPVWHEQKSFKPQELPPWTSPNLEKTVKFLNWIPKADLVKSLRETLSYFRDNEIKIDQTEVVEEEKKPIWEEDKKAALEQLKGDRKEEKGKVQKLQIPKVKFPKGAIVISLLTFLIAYAIILPVSKVGWGVLTFKNQLGMAAENLTKGEFEEGLANISQAEGGLEEAKSIIKSLDSLRQVGWFDSQFESVDKTLSLAELSLSAAKNSILGIEYLYDGLKAVTGELNAKPGEYFIQAKVELDRADVDIAKSRALIADKNFQQGMPKLLRERVTSLDQRLDQYSSLVANARALSSLLPQVVALEGTKSYLILLQNNNELRPTGGFIGSYARVTFENGKLKNLEVNDIYAIDGQLSFNVEPPKEIREDLGQKYWYLRDSNWEADFPTSAKQAEWFFGKETGQVVSGVIALDVSAIENLLEVVGPLDLAEYNEKIGADNLFERAISHAEVSFFPGSQSKKNFITALSNALFNKLFFVPQNNWPGIVSSLGQSLEEKHISIFLDDPKLFSYLISQNWSAVLPRPKEAVAGQISDFLAPVEANLGANKSNYYLKRTYKMETVIGKEGEIKNRLRISYINSSPSDAWPAGKYKNRFRVYLPFGAKVSRVLWGESDITRQIEGFVDYGRSAFSVLLEVKPKEQKTLVVDYELANKLIFEQGEASYKLDVVKQAGTLKDPFEWVLSYPLNYQLLSEGKNQGSSSDKVGPQEVVVSTDLSKDRSFEVRFKK